MTDRADRIANLSPEKRALLEARLRRKSRGRAGAQADGAGARSEGARSVPEPVSGGGKELDFSLFYFTSNAAPARPAEKMRLVVEGARFADRAGFEAVWTPERHFHQFGGLFPNPATTAGALSGITERVHLRAGSVVLPLHDPIRVAEEWSLVDNFSRGRVGIAVASGWHANDFVFAPDAYAGRRESMLDDLETVRTLWRGGTVRRIDGAGKEIELEIFPKPVQSELPVWITVGGGSDTHVRAGAAGANILTHLLGKSVEDIAQRVEEYRAAREANGHDPAAGRVTLMLHTFIGTDTDRVRETVEGPFCDYIRSFTGLLDRLAKSLDVGVDSRSLTPADLDSLLAFAFERYFTTSGLFGTPETALPLVRRLAGVGVDEIACLIDFGVAHDEVIDSLDHLAELEELQRRAARNEAAATNESGTAAIGAEPR